MTLGANKSKAFGLASGSDPQVGDGFLVLISRKLSSSATEMARLKDFDRFDDVFMPPIVVNIFQLFLKRMQEIFSVILIVCSWPFNFYELLIITQMTQRVTKHVCS
jgi:hypothetical protein